MLIHNDIWQYYYISICIDIHNLLICNRDLEYLIQVVIYTHVQN